MSLTITNANENLLIEENGLNLTPDSHTCPSDDGLNLNAELLLREIKAKLKTFISEYTSSQLTQDDRINQISVRLTEELPSEIATAIETMKTDGSLETIINTIMSEYKLDCNAYLPGITSVKKRLNNCDYYETTVPKDYKFKVGIANDDEDFTNLETSLNFAHRKNASLVVNGGVFDTTTKKPLGYVVKDKCSVYSAVMSDEKYGYLGIKENGSFEFYEETYDGAGLIADGCVDAIPIFDKLVVSGSAVAQTDTRDDVRQAFGWKSDGTKIIITTDGRTLDNDGMTYSEIAAIFLGLDVIEAYILDGGGSASTVLYGVKQNENIDFNTDDRKVSTFLYVSKESDIQPDSNGNNAAGKVKQSLIKKFMDHVNFFKGYIRLLSPGFQPGIEMYVKDITSRRSKWGVSYDASNKRNTYAYITLRHGEDAEANNLFRIYPQGTWVQLYQGTSSERPNPITGLMYFDTTLGKPIFYTGTKWVDAAGNDA